MALLLFIDSLLPLFHYRQRPGVSCKVFRKVLMMEIQDYYQRLDNFSFKILEQAIVRVNLYGYLYFYTVMSYTCMYYFRFKSQTTLLFDVIFTNKLNEGHNNS